MAKERLSELQKIILNQLMKDEIEYKKNYGRYSGSPYHGVLLDTARRYDVDMDKDIPGYITNIHDESFSSSFSRSIRNLTKKDLITVNYHKDNFPLKNYYYMSKGKIDTIFISEKGKNLIKKHPC